MRHYPQYFTKKEVLELLRLAFSKGHSAGHKAARDEYWHSQSTPVERTFGEFVASDPRLSRLEEKSKKVLTLP